MKISIYVNDQLIVGPILGEELAYIAKFGGFPQDQLDLMGEGLYGRIDDLRFMIEYAPRKPG